MTGDPSTFPSHEPWRRAAAGLLRGSLARGATVWLRVRTASMVPTIRPGDEVLLRGVAPSELAVGDVVCVRRAADLVVHRLLRRPCHLTKMLATAGDGAPRADPPTPWHDLVGVVAAVRREGRVLAPAGRLLRRGRAWATRARCALRSVWWRCRHGGGGGRGGDDRA